MFVNLKIMVWKLDLVPYSLNIEISVKNTLKRNLVLKIRKEYIFGFWKTWKLFSFSLFFSSSFSSLSSTFLELPPRHGRAVLCWSCHLWAHYELNLAPSCTRAYFFNSSHLYHELTKNPFCLRSPPLKFVGTNDKPLTQATRTSLRKSTPTIVALETNCQRF